MISTKPLPSDEVRVTFTLDRDQPAGATSVVGCFNGWTPDTHPLRGRSNGKRSVSVVLPRGAAVSFRYLTEGGVWTDDPALSDRDEHGNGRITL
ncbi:isoamylase early set domain-containing protein [Umezawaea beigongshangensis]|uniref:isoamylase early set domain-containing protein n=1 Tax=Umezawaea beigongshangensis TaxID=2780383 RepID=UPI0018F15A54|nr:isoamylase early set domain-containing protein [Umezawaea beigongshangensis]